ncbi:Beta-1,3-galactosyltransferase 1 [Phytophthora ramorum]|uniref:Beta-1,3-galactosyltransferase 1 n=1 Tax=Phytophthora ramorum TaxID=164328 RepID=UPI00309BA107|nr:Beta-1,3-galactosyltransferase 1 [Phytophthora ramorum]
MLVRLALLWVSTVLGSCGGYLDAGAQSHTNDSLDPVTAIEIIYPVDGAVEKSPVAFKTQIVVRPGAEHQFLAQAEDVRVCVEVNGETIDCSRVEEPGFQYRQLGSCTARVYLSRSGGRFEWKSVPISFTLVNEAQFLAHVAHAVQDIDRKHRAGFQLSLVEWAHSQWRSPEDELVRRLELDEPRSDSIRETDPEPDSGLLLLVGVKTAVVSHFAFRQAIRETWASKSALPPGVKVLFMGCRPFAVVSEEDGDDLEEDTKLRSVWEAIELEKTVYGDLLTDELDCDDSYFRLADKAKAFFHFAATRYPRAQYVMVADDDLYLRLDEIAARLQRRGQRKQYYAGHVRSIENACKLEPIRDSESRNYLSTGQYPLNELPPFALGANFILSMDCVQFVAKNHRRLRDLGGMDDISVALWMLTVQVHPKAFYGLEYLTAGPCRNDLVSLSDLSESTIRVIHDNVLGQRPFCHGFQRYAWLRQNIGAAAEGRPTLLSFSPEPLDFGFSVSRSTDSVELELGTTISTRTCAGGKVLYSPLHEPFGVYARKLCAHVRLYFPGAARTCAEVTDRARIELDLFFQRLAAAGKSEQLVEQQRGIMAVLSNNVDY